MDTLVGHPAVVNDHFYHHDLSSERTHLIKPVQVGIVEDDRLTRSLVRDTLNSDPWIAVRWAVTGCIEAAKAFEVSPPDIVLMDVGLPDGNGVTLAVRLQMQNLDTRFLFLSRRDYAELVRSAQVPGAAPWSFVRKSELDSADGLKEAVKSVAAGHQLFQRGPESSSGHVRKVLTPTELQVLRLAAQGLSSKRIAEELNCAVSTVDAHLVHVYRKLNCTGASVSPRVAAVIAYLHEVDGFGTVTKA
jgi:DNA-binding NarL/FixJ family response regulator